MLRPIFRRACITVNELITSLVKAILYTSYVSQISALGLEVGFRTGLSAYAFRRGAT